MPEHAHLLVNEPEREMLARALQSLKQSVARTLALRAEDPFWQARYYDFNVWSERKFVEKLRYIHRNPVKAGLCKQPEDWRWSSFRHYLTGADGVVEIESQWTARRREKLGIFPTVQVRTVENPRPAKLGRGTLESSIGSLGWVSPRSAHESNVVSAVESSIMFEGKSNDEALGSIHATPEEFKGSGGKHRLIQLQSAHVQDLAALATW
jgi:hypothetical protein